MNMKENIVVCERRWRNKLMFLIFLSPSSLFVGIVVCSMFCYCISNIQIKKKYIFIWNRTVP
jgi:hypothetical protein